MYLEIEVKSEGMHPSEKLIEIAAVNGTRQAFYDDRAIVRTVRGAYIEIGNPVDEKEGGNLLVDIGREMTDGSHRTWVSKSKVHKTVPLVFLQGDARVMTWGELKAMVEKAGATDDMPIGNIEVYVPIVGGTASAEVIGGNLHITEM